ncbi:elongation factor 1-beta-like [Tropilaelaps mercedesae]|uniref:Elongation factor 1-beta-like n=1 Tax=Tropilaelaps mercedesae TaxID=418985 RepID=A0A1V9XPP5_9ACAR|nr:elongation factor 1-beta-like [Tropilaelaps mercedesae]
MSFGDLKTEAGLKKLNDYLENASYVAGYTPSQVDATTIDQIKTVPTAAKFPYAARWYANISSYSATERKAWPAGGAGDAAAPVVTSGPASAGDDDDIDLFGSDDEVDEEAERVREERLKAYADKKAKKPVLIAKSNVILDVKPWDDETDMKALEAAVRSIEMDGLVWGVSKLIAVGYGIHKLQIVCVVEDDKVSIEELAEKIQEFVDYVQSVDVAAFQKI